MKAQPGEQCYITLLYVYNNHIATKIMAVNDDLGLRSLPFKKQNYDKNAENNLRRIRSFMYMYYYRGI